MTDLTTNKDNLRAEYGEVCANIRWLADVRFKLLGLIPLATILGAWFATSAEHMSILLISLFGLVITVALLIYNERNDQHYGELIARARQLERALGLYGGQFSHRSGTRLTLLGVKVNHSTAVYLVYQASITAWTFGIFYPILFISFDNSLEIFRLTLNYCLQIFTSGQLSIGPPNTDAIARSATVLAATIAVVIAITGVWLFFWYLGRQKKARTKQMEKNAKKAMKIIVRELAQQHNWEDNEEEWGKAIGYLAMVKDDDLKQVVEGYQEKEEQNKTEEQRKTEELERLRKDAENYLNNTIMPRVKLQAGPGRDVKLRKLASDLAASLTSLPAHWYEKMYRESKIDDNDIKERVP